jgi:hypothetical protein
MVEADTLTQVRLLASQHGARLWRNNTGVAYDARGVPVRFGLCNESAAMNQRIKSADLIGIDAEGRFLAVECKHPGWHYTGNAHEAAQKAFLDLINKQGGRAWFAAHPETWWQ